MLTEWAYRERKWGPFPILRRALEDKKIPSKYYGLTSADDNLMDSLNRLVEISILTRKYEEAIKELSQLSARAEIYSGLERFQNWLDSALIYFREQAEYVERLCMKLQV
jgi:DNA repair ATPase RecN